MSAAPTAVALAASDIVITHHSDSDDLILPSSWGAWYKEGKLAFAEMTSLSFVCCETMSYATFGNFGARHA